MIETTLRVIMTIRIRNRIRQICTKLEPSPWSGSDWEEWPFLLSVWPHRWIHSSYYSVEIDILITAECRFQRSIVFWFAGRGINTNTGSNKKVLRPFQRLQFLSTISPKCAHSASLFTYLKTWLRFVFINRRHTNPTPQIFHGWKFCRDYTVWEPTNYCNDQWKPKSLPPQNHTQNHRLWWQVHPASEDLLMMAHHVAQWCELRPRACKHPWQRVGMLLMWWWNVSWGIPANICYQGITGSLYVPLQNLKQIRLEECWRKQGIRPCLHLPHVPGRLFVGSGAAAPVSPRTIPSSSGVSCYLLHAPDAAETRWTFWQWHRWICHPGGAAWLEQVWWAPDANMLPLVVKALRKMQQSALSCWLSVKFLQDKVLNYIHIVCSELCESCW